MPSLYEPLTTETDLLVCQKAEAAGMTVRKLHTNLYDVEGTWCPVIISLISSKWRVSRYAYANRVRRWRTIYYGTRLQTAMEKAKGYESND